MLYQLFLIQVMMYRIRGIKDLLSFKNEECSCFGGVRQGEEQFLAKQKSINIASSPIHNTSNLMKKNDCFFKKSFKKSLKKHFTPVFHQEYVGKVMDGNRAPCEIGTHEPNNRQKAGRDLSKNQNRSYNLNQKTYMVHDEHFSPLYSYSKPHFPQALIKQQSNQASYKALPSFIPTSPRSIITIPTIHSPIHIKINYNSPISQPIISDNHEEQRRNPSPVSMKKLKRSLSNGHIDSNFDPLIKKENEEPSLRKCQSSKQFQSIFHANQLKKMVSESQKEIKQDSHLKEQKFKLKRMDEVAQIYSEIDSQEDAQDSDVESVVLGRLNEYNSAIGQDFSQMSTIERSTQGKVIRLNSLMTNFDFARNRNQETTSQFIGF